MLMDFLQDGVKFASMDFGIFRKPSRKILFLNVSSSISSALK